MNHCSEYECLVLLRRTSP
uniref:Uncharacterized protein n=1 Tax=Lepeophtheirus salmonis TaxID=72036 RepID=A0A0K2VG91_LEPSM